MRIDPEAPEGADLNRRALLALGGSALAGCATQPVATGPGSNFDAWADAFALNWVRLSAERATLSQLLPPEEQRAAERQLSPRDGSRRRQTLALARRGVEQADAWLAAAPGTLSATQRVSAQTLRWAMARELANAPYRDHRFLFDPGGLHVDLVGFLTERHPLRDAADAEAYLDRLAQVGARLDEGLAVARSATARGLLPPRFIAERARGQVQALLAPSPADNVFVTGLARRLDALPALAPDARTRWLARAEGLVTERVRPAWQRLAAFLDELLPRTGMDAGWWRLPDGEAAYRNALAQHTTTTLDAEAIHAIGLGEVARLEAEMDALLRRLGRGSGSVAERVRALSRELQPPAQPDPRPALLKRYDDAVRDAERRSAPLFGLKPRAPVEVRRVPALTERTQSAHYTTPAPDGSRPGIFWVPLPGPQFGMLSLRTLAVHEAVPGHHFQLALQLEAPGLPRWRQRRLFGGGSAHSEGWALYAERLAIEQGWYADDPHALLGALDAQLFRARRLVVDTGLHARRWTRQQGIDYGISPQEVERYVANPGQACAYMIGMRRLLDLREAARAAMGPRFALPAFHDLVLGTGSVPLDVLGEVVQGWQRA